MKAASFEYSRASDLDGALGTLARAEGGCKVMGGSQSLGPMLNLRLARPRQVTDVSALPSLRTVTSTASCVVIGAAVTHAEIEDGVHPALADHPMRSVAADIAYRAIRTRGTVGGSLAHADPASDWVVSLTALGARVHLRSASGSRTVNADAFMLGAYTTVLQDDELIIAVEVPAKTPSTRWAYQKFCRKPGEFAEASAAVYFDAERKHARIALGAVDGAPILLPDLAQELAGKDPAAFTQKRIHQAVRSALPDRDLIDARLFSVCLERALEKAGFHATLPQPTE
jgi:aerobic carbon-monoxide dehydrogenase medium subunit